MIRRALAAAALLSACSSGNAERAATPSGAPAQSAPAAQSTPAVQSNAAAQSNGPAQPAAAAAKPPDSPAPAPTPAAPPPPVEPLGPQEGAELYATACTSCHTSGFVEGTRISEKGWNNEVTKMRKWGALVEESQAAPFAAWLARKFPVAGDAPEAPKLSPAAALATIASHPGKAPAGDPANGQQVFAQACASCHGAAALGTGGGPSLVENPALQQPDRFALLVQKGKGRMPGYDDLKAPDVANLLAYLRAIPGAR